MFEFWHTAVIAKTYILAFYTAVFVKIVVVIPYCYVPKINSKMRQPICAPIAPVTRAALQYCKLAAALDMIGHRDRKPTLLFPPAQGTKGKQCDLHNYRGLPTFASLSMVCSVCRVLPVL